MLASRKSIPPVSDLAHRAAIFAALGEPIRLAVVDALRPSDLSPSELGDLLNIPSNLLARHLDVLEQVGVVSRRTSGSDRRRKYIRLQAEALQEVLHPVGVPVRSALFICTHNSARSQIAAALWRARTGQGADSAGTDPGKRVHVGAVRAARRAGIELAGATPKTLGAIPDSVQVITVCDAAHESLSPLAHDNWWHWSIPDPAVSGDSTAFDAVVDEVSQRISVLLVNPASEGRTA